MRSKNECLIEMAKRICGIDMSRGVPSYFHPDVTPELECYEWVMSPQAASAVWRMNKTAQSYHAWKDMLMPKQVIFNGITTVCIFGDNTKVISRPQKGEVFCKETGVAMCIAKYVYGSRSKFLKAVDKGKQQ
jgi:hypothetical protein